MTGEGALGRTTGRLPSLIIRHRRAIAVFWALLAVTLLPAALDLPARLQPSTRLHTGEAAEAERILREDFGGLAGGQAILVIDGVPQMESEPGRSVLAELTAALAENPWVIRVTSHLNMADPLLLGADGMGAVVIVRLAETPAMDAVMRSLRETTAPLAPRIQARFPDARVMWTGDLALDNDVLMAGNRDSRRAEARALPLTFALLLWAFGAIVAAFCPTMLAVFAIGLALGVAAIVSLWWAPSILLQNVVSLLGLALGIDYALLMVSRFREHLERDPDPLVAAEQTVRDAGRSVVLSGSTVAIGFSALLAVPVQEPRSVAVGGLLVTLFSVLLATTLLPALLVQLGRKVNLGRIGKLRRPTGLNEGWYRWGLRVMNRPVLILVCTAAPLLALAWPAQRITMSLPDEGWLPPATEAARGLQALERMERAGLVYRIRVLFRLPEGMQALEPAGWDALEHLQRHLESDERVERVVSLPSLASPGVPVIMLRVHLPDHVRGRFVSRDGAWALFDVVPRRSLNPSEMMGLARDIRRLRPERFSGEAGGRLLVGGLPAATADYQEVIVRWFPWVVALVIAGTFLALLIGFRSLVIPLKAVLLNLLSVGAAYGALDLVFLEGYGIGLFGLSGPVGGVFPAIPLLAFCTVFGISMDYEVFLLSRIAEARRQTVDEAEAIAQGLARTAGLITSAAAIMLAVFGAFALGEFLPVQMLGFTLAVAVFLDATLVRIALGPALLRLAGRWNWWPGDAAAAGRS